jgi:hypothetical protein
MYKIGILFSNEARDWNYLREHDPDYGKTYEVICAATDKSNAIAIEQFRNERIPCHVVDREAWKSLHPHKHEEREIQAYCENLKKIFYSFTPRPDAILVSEYQSKIAHNFFWALRTIGVRKTGDVFEIFEMSNKPNGGKKISCSNNRFEAIQVSMDILIKGGRDPDNLSF